MSKVGGGQVEPVQWNIIGSGHMGIFPEQNDRQTPVKTLPSRNFFGGRLKCHSHCIIELVLKIDIEKVD